MNYLGHGDYREHVFLPGTVALRHDVDHLKEWVDELNIELEKLEEDFDKHVEDSNAHFVEDEKQLFYDLLSDAATFVRRRELESYYTKEEIDLFGFLKEVPDYYVTEEELQQMIDSGVLLNKEAISELLKNYYTKEEIDNRFQNSGFITAAYLSNYYTKQEIDDFFNKSITGNVSYSSSISDLDKGTYKLGTLNVGSTSYDIIGYLGGSTDPDDPEEPDSNEGMIIGHFVLIYIISATQPDSPNEIESGSYNFYTGELNIKLLESNGWSTTIPEKQSSKDRIWTSSKYFYSNGKDTEWSMPIELISGAGDIFNQISPSYSYSVRAYYGFEKGATIYTPQGGIFDAETKQLTEPPYHYDNGQQKNWSLIVPDDTSKEIYVSYNNYIVTDDEATTHTDWSTPVKYFPNIQDILDKAKEVANDYADGQIKGAKDELYNKYELLEEDLNNLKEIYDDADESSVTFEWIVERLKGYWDVTSMKIDKNKGSLGKAMIDLSYDHIKLEVEKASGLDGSVDQSSISKAILELVNNKASISVANLGPVEDILGELCRKINETRLDMTPDRIVLEALSGTITTKYNFTLRKLENNMTTYEKAMDVGDTVFVQYLKYHVDSSIYDSGIAKCVELSVLDKTYGVLQLVDEYADSLGGKYYLAQRNATPYHLMIREDFAASGTADNGATLITSTQNSVKQSSVESALMEIVSNRITLSVASNKDTKRGAFFELSLNDKVDPENDGTSAQITADRIYLTGETIAAAIAALEMNVNNVTHLLPSGEVLMAIDTEGSSVFRPNGTGYLAGGLIKYQRDTYANDNLALQVRGIIDADGGLIGGWTIGDNKLYSNDRVWSFSIPQNGVMTTIQLKEYERKLITCYKYHSTSVTTQYTVKCVYGWNSELRGNYATLVLDDNIDETPDLCYLIYTPGNKYPSIEDDSVNINVDSLTHNDSLLVLGDQTTKDAASIQLTPSAIYVVNEQGRTTWQLSKDGSGQLGNSGISWDTRGSLTIGEDVKVNANLTARDIYVGSENSFFAKDGSGYVANQNIAWDKDGNITLGKSNLTVTGNVFRGATIITKDNFNDYFKERATAYVPDLKKCGDMIIINSVPSNVESLLTILLPMVIFGTNDGVHTGDTWYVIHNGMYSYEDILSLSGRMVTVVNNLSSGNINVYGGLLGYSYLKTVAVQIDNVEKGLKIDQTLYDENGPTYYLDENVTDSFPIWTPKNKGGYAVYKYLLRMTRPAKQYADIGHGVSCWPQQLVSGGDSSKSWSGSTSDWNQLDD